MVSHGRDAAGVMLSVGSIPRSPSLYFFDIILTCFFCFFF